MPDLVPELTWQVRAARAILEGLLRKHALGDARLLAHFEEVFRCVIERDAALNRLFFVAPDDAVKTIFARLFVPVRPT